MESITFNCPQCDFVCAFRREYAGRGARCLRCGQRFVIPDKDGGKAKKIKQAKREFDEPVEGFYQAVLKKSSSAIFSPESRATLTFILTLIVFKYFTVHWNFEISIPTRSGVPLVLVVYLGGLIKLLVWGALFYCYSEIIYSTAYDIEALPVIYFGGGFGFLCAVVRSLYRFLICLLFVLLPCVFVNIIFAAFGVDKQWPLYLFAFLGMFLFPMAILSVGLANDLTMIANLDNYLTPIKKAFKPYLFVAVLFIAAAHLQYVCPNYGDIKGKSFVLVPIFLLLNIAIQLFLLVCMRAIGLFHRHYNCYFNW